MNPITREAQLTTYVDKHQDRLVQIVRDLVRIPSQNTPPVGAEAACQSYVAAFLRNQGWEPLMYELDHAPGIHAHPLFYGGRKYTGRPNVGARKPGTGGGRSLLLSGHIDTVPKGTQPWTHDPFGGEIDGNRLFGRGSNDMKGGIAINLFVIEALAHMNLSLAGDLLFETVVDEEFGGVNGTLAGRLKGFNADAAIIPEPSLLRVCPAQRGGRIVHILLEAPGGVITERAFPAGVVDQLTLFLAKVKEFAAARRAKAVVHELYAEHVNPVPVAITKIVTAPWGTSEPVTVPEQCRIEMYWQTMPGEEQKDVEREFLSWLDSVVASAPHLFPKRPELEFPIRWLPGSAIPKSESLVRELAASAADATGNSPPVVGFEAPCDMYVFHQAFGIPAVLWGPRGGNTHAADEYVEIDSLVDAAKTLLVFVSRWCGVTA
ncbi:MAG TPA: M20/M25/M40 family metallo-hydrolase [Bryobacteraceae bacterium]|jgi:acetylornithine deacetylase